MTRIVGRPIVFNVDSVDLGGFIEQIDPAAVDRTLRDRSQDVVALRNHDSNLPLARRSARSLLLVPEHAGLTIDALVDTDVSFAADTVRMIRRRDAAGGSFAFRVLDDVWTLRNGTPFRRVLDMVVSEVSVAVTFPAYPSTAFSVEERTAPAGKPQVVRDEKYYSARLKLAR